MSDITNSWLVTLDAFQMFWGSAVNGTCCQSAVKNLWIHRRSQKNNFSFIIWWCRLLILLSQILHSNGRLNGKFPSVVFVDFHFVRSLVLFCFIWNGKKYNRPRLASHVINFTEELKLKVTFIIIISTDERLTDLRVLGLVRSRCFCEEKW